MNEDRDSLGQYLSEYRLSKAYIPLESDTIARHIDRLFGANLDYKIYDVIYPDWDPRNA